mgnify:FL=1
MTPSSSAGATPGPSLQQLEQPPYVVDSAPCRHGTKTVGLHADLLAIPTSGGQTIDAGTLAAKELHLGHDIKVVGGVVC